MEPLFLDTSALAKRYVYESGSEWISNIFSDDEKKLVYVAELTSAVVRRSKGGSIPSDEVSTMLSAFDRHLLTDYFVLEINSEILWDARLLIRSHGLRSYDAVQLAVAEKFNSGQIEMNLPIVTFVSADNELLTAAQADGLLIQNPNDYA